ncbi:hypothetical protein D3C77_513040 [compost metagenome]
MQDAIVGLLLQLHALLHALRLLVAHAYAGCGNAVLALLACKLPLKLCPVLLGLSEALGALDGGRVVDRGLGQCLAVFFLADLALAKRQIKLALLLGKRACCLGCRVILVVKAGEGRFRL